MPEDEQDAIPSPVDPAYECVRVDAQQPPGAPAQAPSLGGAGGPALCPPGYVPRLRRRESYQLRGKEVVTDTEPEENPEGPR